MSIEMSQFSGQNLVISGLITVSLGIYLIYYFHRKKVKKYVEDPPKLGWILAGYVTKLYVYPLKSGKAIEVKMAYCTNTGLQQVPIKHKHMLLKDRSLAVYGAKEFDLKSGKTHTKLTQISVVPLNEDSISFTAPEMKPITIKIPKTQTPNVAIKFWMNEEVPSIDCGEEVALWLSKYLLDAEFGMRLGYNNGSTQRKIPDKLRNWPFLTNSTTGLFSDLSSVLLINQKSIDALKDRVKNSAAVITAENFRPNIIVDTNLSAYDEDKWDWLRIGDELIVRNVKDCTRCTFINVDAATGRRNPAKEPLATLETYRPCKIGPETAPIMGLNLGVKRTGFIYLNDPIYIIYK